VQPAIRVIQDFREAARGVLRHPLLELTAAEIELVGLAFSEAIRARNYTC
jgi:hypothetical protein